MRKLTLAACVIGAAVVGCGKKRVDPGPEQTVDLAGKKATWHDWKMAPVCFADDHVVETDFASMKDLLLTALGSTSASFDGAWSEENLATLEKIPKVLPDALAALDRGVADAQQCQWKKESKVPELLTPLQELVSQAKRKVEGGPALLAKVKSYQALKAWREKQPEAKESAKKDWCPAKPRPGQPDIYYASEDETGRTEWLFCDESKVVVASPGNPPAFEASATLKKKPKDKGYLDAASKYPVSDIQRPPGKEDATAKKDEGGSGGG